jgi:hypothetical protein
VKFTPAMPAQSFFEAISNTILTWSWMTASAIQRAGIFMEGAIMSIRSNRAWLSGSRNRFHQGGAPQSIGRKGRRAGVWKVFSLAGRAIGFLVGSGDHSGHPVAMVFGSGRNNHPTAKDYRTARAIAADHRRASRETWFIFDLRRILKTRVPSWLLSIVLMPADNKGRAVRGDTFEGTMYRMEPRSKWSRGGLAMFTSVIGSGTIPWEGLGHVPRHQISVEVPRFDAAIGGSGWAPVPSALNDHLNKIDPRPNKNNGQIAVETLSPGQLESNEATVFAAA